MPFNLPPRDFVVLSWGSACVSDTPSHSFEFRGEFRDLGFVSRIAFVPLLVFFSLFVPDLAESSI